MEKIRTYRTQDEINRLYDIADELDAISELFAHPQMFNEAVFNATLAKLAKLIDQSNEYNLKSMLRNIEDKIPPRSTIEERFSKYHDLTRKMAKWVRNQKDYLRANNVKPSKENLDITKYGNFFILKEQIYYGRDGFDNMIRLTLPNQQTKILELLLQAHGYTANANEIAESVFHDKEDTTNVSESVRKLKIGLSKMISKQCHHSIDKNTIITGTGQSPRSYTLNISV